MTSNIRTKSYNTLARCGLCPDSDQLMHPV
jgi:hypothetical protein